MSNMSYCRFQNTVRDLRDCEGALEELLEGIRDADSFDLHLSNDELEAAKDLTTTCASIINLIAERVGVDFDIDEVKGQCERALQEVNDEAKRADKEFKYDREIEEEEGEQS